jgi:hypothetical protein
MPDYQNGKVYKITSGDKTYIGSTCEPTLARRLAGHVKDYKRWKEGKRRGVSSFQLIESGQYEITLVELYPCNSKDELTARERFHIETNECVNIMVPKRTQHERWITNHNGIKEKHKVYAETHMEAQLKQQRDKYKENPLPKQEYREKNKEKQRLYMVEYNRKKREAKSHII